ncbi:MAG: recombinase family protein, partial [Clostridiales bacterium]|nr:recombinase family protein [Clostridiales bacterium]
MNKRAVIYARYSSDKQTESSIDAQVRACKKYADEHGLTVVEIYKDEAISGKGSSVNKRAGYQKMLRDVKKNKFDIVLIHKYDRMARSVVEHFTFAAKLEEENVELIAVAQSVGDGKEAKLMKTLYFVLSEHYLDNLSEEVKKGHKENAIKALHNGGVPPFGYDVKDKRYVINELEASYVRRMFQLAIEEKGYTELIKEMAAAGIKGKRGAEIKYPQINEILKNEKYTGVYLYCQTEAKERHDRRTKEGAIRIEDAFPPIIEKETFLLVREKMKKRSRTGRAAKREYLCSGKVFCSCGAPMHASTTTRKGHEYPIYSCSNRCGIGT